MPSRRQVSWLLSRSLPPGPAGVAARDCLLVGGVGGGRHMPRALGHALLASMMLANKLEGIWHLLSQGCT